MKNGLAFILCVEAMIMELTFLGSIFKYVNKHLLYHNEYSLRTSCITFLVVQH